MDRELRRSLRRAPAAVPGGSSWSYSTAASALLTTTSAATSRPSHPDTGWPARRRISTRSTAVPVWTSTPSCVASRGDGVDDATQPAGHVPGAELLLDERRDREHRRGAAWIGAGVGGVAVEPGPQPRIGQHRGAPARDASATARPRAGRRDGHSSGQRGAVRRLRRTGSPTRSHSRRRAGVQPPPRLRRPRRRTRRPAPPGPGRHRAAAPARCRRRSGRRTRGRRRSATRSAGPPVSGTAARARRACVSSDGPVSKRKPSRSNTPSLPPTVAALSNTVTR